MRLKYIEIKARHDPPARHHTVNRESDSQDITYEVLIQQTGGKAAVERAYYAAQRLCPSWTSMVITVVRGTERRS